MTLVLLSTGLLGLRRKEGAGVYGQGGGWARKGRLGISDTRRRG